MLYESFNDAQSREFVVGQKELSNSKISLMIYDTPGLDEYYNGVINTLSKANLIFIVHDLSKNFDQNIKSYMTKVVNDIKNKAGDKFVLIASKSDRKYTHSVNYSENLEFLKGFARNFSVSILITSGEDNRAENIDPYVDKIIFQGNVKETRKLYY